MKENNTWGWLVTVLHTIGARIVLNDSCNRLADEYAAHDNFTLTTTAMESLNVHNFLSDAVVDKFLSLFSSDDTKILTSDFILPFCYIGWKPMAAWPIFDEHQSHEVSKIIIPMKEGPTMTWGVAVITRNEKIRVYDPIICNRTFQTAYPWLLL